MENVIINSTLSTPAVFFNIKRGVLILSGKSFPEDATIFYKSLETNIDKFINENPEHSLSITCEFEYINTSSSKALYNIFKKIKEKIKNISIVWGCEEDDDDMKEQGEYFEEALNLQFEFRTFQAENKLL